MFHGNPLLTGWTLSDVAFYPTRADPVRDGAALHRPDGGQIHIAAAITYTMIVLLAAILAKGRATGLQGWLRVGVTVAILLVPVPGTGYQTLLSSPNHTGSAVPLLLAWGRSTGCATRRGSRSWWRCCWAGARRGDPLVTFVGAVPLALTCLVRAWRLPGVVQEPPESMDFQLARPGARRWCCPTARPGVLKAIGGYHTPRPPIELSPWDEWFGRAHMTARMLGVLFGTHRPGWQSKCDPAGRVVPAPGRFRGRADRGGDRAGAHRARHRRPDRVDHGGGDLLRHRRGDRLHAAGRPDGGAGDLAGAADGRGASPAGRRRRGCRSAGGRASWPGSWRC